MSCATAFPADKALKDGDIVNIDVTPIVDGWHGDTSRMYLVGDVAVKASKLVDVTYECLMLGLEQARPGNRLGDVAHAIQSHAEKQRYSVVRDFCGHGLGQLFHDAPEVVHAGRPGTGVELKPGMIFTVEPMINIGRADCKILDDGWTAVTRDRSLSAQFEHSIGITETGCEIFTKSPSGLGSPALRLLSIVTFNPNAGAIRSTVRYAPSNRTFVVAGRRPNGFRRPQVLLEAQMYERLLVTNKLGSQRLLNFAGDRSSKATTAPEGLSQHIRASASIRAALSLT